MKHITICIVLMLISVISLSQQTTPSQTISSQEYLQKSKHQRNTGLILAGGGLVLEIAGAVAYHSGNSSIFLLGARAFTNSKYSIFCFFPGERKKIKESFFIF
ncbi:MAG: hypothetical protein ACTHM5_02830 [Ginsengibacter sp.]